MTDSPLPSWPLGRLGGLALLAMAPTAQALAAPPAPPDDARGAIAIYCTQSCGELVLDGAKAAIRLPRTARRWRVAASPMAAEAFGLPTDEQLRTRGRGDLSGLPAAGEVLVVEWAGPAAGAEARTVEVLEAAAQLGGWVEDLDTGVVMDAHELGLVVAGLRDGPTDVSLLMAVETAEASRGDGLQLRTRGLRKLGLPDLVLTDVSEASEGELAIALNAVAQAVSEQGLRPRVEVDAGLQSWPAAIAGCEASGVASLRYAPRRLQQDDNAVALVSWSGTAACPQRDEAADGPAQADAGPEAAAVLASGSTDGLAIPVEPTVDAAESLPPPPTSLPSSLEEAQAQAHQRLRGPIKAALQAGTLGQAELFVKAPFTAEGGRVEWLWAEVAEWTGDDVLRGTLQSQPALSQSISAGDPVEVPIDLVFDYLLRHPDGSQEGNRTGPFVQ